MSEPFISINELSKRLDVPAHTLRYWEKQFPSAIRPTTGAGGRRYYREDMAATIAQVKNLLHDQGYTIAGVRKLLANGELGSDSSVAGLVRQNVTVSKSNVCGDEFVIPAQVGADITRALELLDCAIVELK